MNKVNNTCSVDGCEEIIDMDGLCKECYNKEFIKNLDELYIRHKEEKGNE